MIHLLFPFLYFEKYIINSSSFFFLLMLFRLRCMVPVYGGEGRVGRENEGDRKRGDGDQAVGNGEQKEVK